MIYVLYLYNQFNEALRNSLLRGRQSPSKFNQYLFHTFLPRWHGRMAKVKKAVSTQL